MSAVAETDTQHQSLHKRRVNDLIYESLQDLSDTQPVAFFCECTSLRCFDAVWLSVDDYEAARLNERHSGLSWAVVAAKTAHTASRSPSS